MQKEIKGASKPLRAINPKYNPRSRMQKVPQSASTPKNKTQLTVNSQKIIKL
jgi:hypothetical protein